ncbi:hypothetical protein ABH902_001817 [Enterococcus sp. UD-01]|jgi:hypothetical protein
MKLPKSLTFDHRLIKVEANVVQAQAIVVKDEQCVLCIGGFYEIAEESDI